MKPEAASGTKLKMTADTSVILSRLPTRGRLLQESDADLVGTRAAAEVERLLSFRDDHRPTPLHDMVDLARELDVATLHIKDEGHRLGLGSFKALGGSTAVIRLALEAAAEHLGRPVGFADLHDVAVREIAAGLTVACATDGNHGRSVASGAKLVGAKAAVFVHAGVSRERVDAMARLGATTIMVEGTYDDSVAECTRVCTEKGWIVVSDTSWPGYEHIPGLVMQGYAVMVREAMAALSAPPTHVFMQAGVGGLAAAVAGHLAVVLGEARPTFVVVEPSRAACLFASAAAGHRVKVERGGETVMAMLECYEPSLVAWRILERAADGFMTIEDEDAVAAMRRLAQPGPRESVVVAGESGGAGLAGLMRAARDPWTRAALGLSADARVFLINTEGATDPDLYRALVGATPEQVLARNHDARGPGER